MSTALVTGAASGIGYGVAKTLAQNGAAVILNDLSRELADAAQKLNGEAWPGDVTDPALLQVLKERRIDILVNNAGFQHIAPDF